jgi:hypothetical protein
MGRRLPSLRPGGEPADHLDDSWWSRNKRSRAWPIVAWIVVWIPISLLFPLLNAHIPVPPFLMPVFFVFFSSGGRDHFAATYLPAMVFWVGLVLALVLHRLLFKRKEAQE